jgi:hypothetical protein
MIEALENDELLHEALAIVGRQTLGSPASPHPSELERLGH